MRKKLQKLIKKLLVVIDQMAKGMIYGNLVNSNGGGVVFLSALE